MYYECTKVKRPYGAVSEGWCKLTISTKEEIKYQGSGSSKQGYKCMQCRRYCSSNCQVIEDSCQLKVNIKEHGMEFRGYKGVECLKCKSNCQPVFSDDDGELVYLLNCVNQSSQFRHSQFNRVTLDT